MFWGRRPAEAGGGQERGRLVPGEVPDWAWLRASFGGAGVSPHLRDVGGGAPGKDGGCGGAGDFLAGKSGRRRWVWYVYRSVWGLWMSQSCEEWGLEVWDEEKGEDDEEREEDEGWRLR